MKIDWFTIAAQALNFLVLLWLMKRFLYKPILHAIDEREKRITEELANTETGKAKAEKLKDEYDQKNADLNRQSADFLKKAQDAGQAERLRLLYEAREAAEALSAKRREALAEDEKTSRQAISRRTQGEVLAIARKVLTDFAGTSLEERVVGVFSQRLRDLGEAEIKNLTSALKTRPGMLTAQTALDISPELRASTEASINEIFGTSAQVTFENAPDLISGRELNVKGQKVEWSIADYLSSIEEGSDDFLKKRSEDDETEEPSGLLQQCVRVNRACAGIACSTAQATRGRHDHQSLDRYSQSVGAPRRHFLYTFAASRALDSSPR